VERLAVDAGGDHTQQIDGVAVGDPSAGLMHQRQLRQLPQPGVRPLIERQPHVSLRDRAGHRESVGQAAGVGQQILDQDRPVHRVRPVQRTVRIVEHLHVGQFRGPAHDRIFQRELALVDQAHHRGDRDRLGHRRDAEQGVPLHRQARVDVPVPDLVELQHFSVLPDHRYRTGE